MIDHDEYVLCPAAHWHFPSFWNDFGTCCECCNVLTASRDTTGLCVGMFVWGGFPRVILAQGLHYKCVLIARQVDDLNGSDSSALSFCC
jgi:hypothetical protein